MAVHKDAEQLHEHAGAHLIDSPNHHIANFSYVAAHHPLPSEEHMRSAQIQRQQVRESVSVLREDDAQQLDKWSKCTSGSEQCWCAQRRRLIDRGKHRDLSGLTAFSLFVSSSTPQTDAVRTVFSMNVP